MFVPQQQIRVKKKKKKNQSTPVHIHSGKSDVKFHAIPVSTGLSKNIKNLSRCLLKSYTFNK